MAEDDVVVMQELHAANAHRERYTKLVGGFLIPSHYFTDEYFPYVVDQLTGAPHNLQLLGRHLDILQNPDLNDPHIARLKFNTMSHLIHLEEVKAAAQNTTLQVNCTVDFQQDGEYIFHLPENHRVRVHPGDRVVVCRAATMNDANEKRVMGYSGSVDPTGTAVRCLHNDPEHAFAVNERVNIFAPPFDGPFEASQYAIHALQNDPHFQLKFYGDVEDDITPIPAEDVCERENFNDSQMQAINGVLQHDPRKCFAVIGPPGTGKTEILCKAVEVEWLKERGSKFLIVASSNAAVNVIASRLIARQVIPPFRIRRAFAPGVHVNTVPADLQNIAWVDNGRFYIPGDRAPIVPFDVIICTISVSYRMSCLGKQFFTHIMFDENGQSLEIDTSVPVAYFANKDTRVSLFGDPMQLSPFFADGILGQERFNATSTTIGRLSETDLYRDNPNLCVTLNTNYRSHPSIVDLFSTLFYNSQVVVHEPVPEDLRQFENSAILDNQRVPIRFHVCIGEEMPVLIDGRQSFQNNAEVLLIERYVEALQNHGVTDEEIGIVVPYRAQIVAINARIRNLHPAILIDTVNRFQGNEKSVIITTCVRTARAGFMNDQRRLNVAISRAKRMMIIVGNLEFLCTIDHFRRMALQLHHMGCLHDDRPNVHWEAILTDPILIENLQGNAGNGNANGAGGANDNDNDAVFFPA